MNNFAKMTIAVFITMALASPLYASGDMNKSSKKQGEASATMDKSSMQKHDTAAMDKQSMHMEHAGTIPSADKLRGMEVYSQQGEEIGNIEEVAVNDQTGDIKYVTLSKGGILGIGGEEIPLPLEALTFEDDRATLTVDASKLDSAPKQANASDEQFQRDLQSHYGVSPAWKQDSSNMDKDKGSMQDNMGEDTTKPDLKSKSILDDPENKKSDY